MQIDLKGLNLDYKKEQEKDWYSIVKTHKNFFVHSKVNNPISSFQNFIKNQQTLSILIPINEDYCEYLKHVFSPTPSEIHFIEDVQKGLIGIGQEVITQDSQQLQEYLKKYQLQPEIYKQGLILTEEIQTTLKNIFIPFSNIHFIQDVTNATLNTEKKIAIHIINFGQTFCEQLQQKTKKLTQLELKNPLRTRLEKDILQDEIIALKEIQELQSLHQNELYTAVEKVSVYSQHVQQPAYVKRKEDQSICTFLQSPSLFFKLLYKLKDIQQEVNIYQYDYDGNYISDMLDHIF